MNEKPKKTTITYHSNLDYYKTYEKLRLCPEIQSLDMEKRVGILAWFKGSPKFHIRISPEGTVVITLAKIPQIELALNILRTYGVPSEGEGVKLYYKTRSLTNQELKMALNDPFISILWLIQHVGIDRLISPLRQTLSKKIIPENLDIIFRYMDWSKITLPTD